MRRFLQLSVLYPLFLLPAFAARAQDWMPAEDGHGFYIQRQFFQRVELLFRGMDSLQYILTSHAPDRYWKKKNDERELALSRIGPDGRVSLVKKLETFAGKPMIKAFNNKYYVLDNELQVRKKDLFYRCFVYSSDWVFLSAISLKHVSGQMGFSDFVVDAADHFYLFTEPAAGDRKPGQFAGTQLMKLTPSGEWLKLKVFDQSLGQHLRLQDNALFFQISRQKFMFPVYQPDSLQDWKSDLDLNAFMLAARVIPASDRRYKEQVRLSGGQQLVYYDSSYSTGPQSWASVFRMAMLDAAGNKLWTKEPDGPWLYARPVALSNGDALLQVDKRWTTTELIRLGADGKETLVKSLPLVADTRADRYRFNRYFEWEKGAILFFYIRETPQRQERLYVERKEIR